MLCGVAYNLVVGYTKACHINAHIGGRAVGRASVNTLENSVEHRKYLYVAVVIYGGFPVCFKMKRVYHINVVEVGCCRLICEVYGCFNGRFQMGKVSNFAYPALTPCLFS